MSHTYWCPICKTDQFLTVTDQIGLNSILGGLIGNSIGGGLGAVIGVIVGRKEIVVCLNCGKYGREKDFRYS